MAETAKPAPKQKSARTKTTLKKRAPKKTMSRKKAARKQEVNKSQAIRDALKQHPKAGPKEISEILSKQGIKVSAVFVSNVKSISKKKRGRRKKATAAVKPAVSDKVSISTLVQAKNLADQIGGVEKAKQMLDTLAKLV